MSSSREVVESKQPQLFANLHPTTTLSTQPTQSSIFPPQRGRPLQRPESIIMMMDRKEWQLFVQTVQLLDSI